MATPAAKTTCSPNFSSQKPNARSSELNNPMRRSFKGNPFSNKPSIVTNPRGFNPNTPAYSPSDFPRRHSTGRESLASLHDYEDKENGKDQSLKLGRVRSPTPLKGTKNFMSPTVSAASKITVSPRKKILSERNESVRSSISFPDVRNLIMEESKTAPKIVMKQNKVEDSNDSSVIDCCGHNESLKSDSDIVIDSKVSEKDSSITDEKDFVNVDPSFKISPRVTPPCPILAPLDADPLMPPYDPKTNYLSPRPQFLHYRPNPRIERYRETGGKQLDEIFQSECFSDTEEAQSEHSQRELEESLSSETIKDEEEELHVSEPKPITMNTNVKSFEAKMVSRASFLTRSKLNTLLLALTMAYFSILASDSALLSPTMLTGFNASEIQIPPEVIESVKANFEELAQNLRYWSAKSLSYNFKMIFSSSEVYEIGPLAYANLSSVLEDQMDDGCPMFGCSVLEPAKMKKVKNEALDEKNDGKIEAGEIDEAAAEEENEPGFEGLVHQEAGVHESLEMALEEKTIESEDEHEGIEAEVIKSDHMETYDGKEGTEFAADVDIEPQNSKDLGGQEGLILTATEIQPLESKPEEPKGELDMSKNDEIVSDEVEFNPGNPENSPEKLQTITEAVFAWDTFKASVDKLPYNPLGISLVLLCLLASVAVIYAKKGQPSVQKSSIPVEQPVLAKKHDHSPASASGEHTFPERLSSRNWQTEVDMANEYCPSEMSSYENSASFSSRKGLKGDSGEAQSKEMKSKKNHWRESLASSECSMDSFSYGSFTTYEKIPRKHGDEEIVTPVRRSSRIRNEVASPI